MLSHCLHLDSLEPFAQDICSSVDILIILPSLIAHRLVTRFDQEYFMSALHTSSEKQLKLMCLVISLNEKCVEKFLQCLSQTVGEHPLHGELLEKICKGIVCTSYSYVCICVRIAIYGTALV